MTNRCTFTRLDGKPSTRSSIRFSLPGGAARTAGTHLDASCTCRRVKQRARLLRRVVWLVVRNVRCSARGVTGRVRLHGFFFCRKVPLSPSLGLFSRHRTLKKLRLPYFEKQPFLESQTVKVLFDPSSTGQFYHVGEIFVLRNFRDHPTRTPKRE